MKSILAASLLLCSAALAQGRPPPQPPEAPRAPMGPPGGPGGMGGPGGPGGMFPGPVGIPPQVAQKLGISPELTKKVRDLGFESNEQLIGLEADLKRAQLDLERYLSGATVEEATALTKLETVGRHETAVRKNRMALMIRVRKALGPELWSKLEAELPMGGPGGPGGRREMHGPRGRDGEGNE